MRIRTRPALGTAAAASYAAAAAVSAAAAAAAATALIGSVVYPCTATFANNAGFGQYTLTPVGVTIPATLPAGARVTFVVPTTAVTGRVMARVVGVTSPAGFLWVKSGDGRTFTGFGDFAAGDVVTFELTAGGDWALISSLMSRVQSLFPHGTVGISSGGLMGTPGGQIINFGPFDGGNIVIKDPVSGQFRMVHFTTSGIQTIINNATCYKEGVPNSSLPNNTFWYIYAFLKSSDPEDIALDFSQTTPGQSVAGHRVKANDDSRSYIGITYTLNGDVGFNGTGSKPQILVHSIFNPTLLPVMTVGVTPLTGVGSTFTDIPDATISVALDAVTCLPVLNCICGFTNDTDEASVEMRLKVTGIAVDAGGVETPFTNYSDVFQATCHKATKFDQICGQYGQALATGFIAVIPQVRNLTGVGTYKPSHLGYLWQ